MIAADATANLLTLQPIGFVRTGIHEKVAAPRQPRAGAGVRGRIELLSGRNFEHALDDLAGWEFIWVVFWFHLNPSWRPKVLPPLERVEGLTLYVSDPDMVDGTPVLDLKPYVAYTDAYPAAGSGWLDDAALAGASELSPTDPIAAFDVQFDALAAEQAVWIESRSGLEISERIRATLALGPAPHPYRRIRRRGDALQLAVKEWRVRFAVAGRKVRVLDICSGYRASQLAAAPDHDATFAAHREFAVLWKRSDC